MDNLLWKTALWRQMGAALDTLGNMLMACPDELWQGVIWRNYTDEAFPEDFATFWYISYHTLFWLDLYVSGKVEGFAPPEPFTLGELDPAGVLPERVYTREELHTYLLYGREKCRTTIMELTDERALQLMEFPWHGDNQLTFYELLLYNMRHLQEHAAQLGLFLGRNGVAKVPGWVSQAREDQ